jgi:hypothetical protein
VPKRACHPDAKCLDWFLLDTVLANCHTEREASIMEKQDVIRIAEGLRLIEEGVETIQSVMKEKNIKSLKDVAAELIPFFKKDDDSLTDSIISHLE